MSATFIFGLSALLHFYIGARLVQELPAPASWVLAGWLLVSSVLMPMGMAARRFMRGELAERVSIAGLIAMGFFSSLLVGTFLRDLLLIAFGIAHTIVPAWFSFSSLERVSAEIVPVAALVVTVIGFLNARRIAGVVHVQVPIDGLPAGLEGFSIAQITDVHVGPTIRREYVQGIVDAVNRIDADIIAITGDLVDGSVANLRDHVAPLAQLKARHGVFFVTGNHEYYSGALPWMDEMRRLGITVLHNGHTVLEHDGEQLVLAGVPDYSAGHFHDDHASDPGLSLQGAPAHLKKVLLAHQPRTAHAASRAGFDLQISGHTHGGQFWPWNHFVRLQQPYTAGLHRMDQLWVYVSRGTGYWGPPKRFGAPSEITRLSLQRASA